MTHKLFLNDMLVIHHLFTNSRFSFTGVQNERVVWFKTCDCSPVTFQLVVFSSSHPRNKSHWTLNVSAHIIISNLCVWLHRRPCRAAPVHDGRQEGGQHVLHDLVHQLVLNRFWYDRLKTPKMLMWAGGGGECGRCVHEPTGNPKRGRRWGDRRRVGSCWSLNRSMDESRCRPFSFSCRRTKGSVWHIWALTVSVLN